MSDKENSERTFWEFDDKDISKKISYADFEKAHKNEESINRKLDSYIEALQNKGFDFANIKAIDIGSGRGDWLKKLEIYTDSALGIDIDKEMVEMCEASGLKVIEEDFLKYAKKIESQSVDLVSAFQIIEHMTTDDLLMLIHEVSRILKPGGFIVLETPNTQNMLTGLYNFHADPTHKRPIHIVWLDFVLVQMGFHEIEQLFIDEDAYKELKQTDERIVKSILHSDIKKLLRQVNTFANAQTNLSIIAKR
ncbi:MAG: class I SAM-dependent methyltransferase [Eubacteriales bacterium]